MTPLPLTADQIRTLQESGEVETWTKMEPQPEALKGWDGGARVKVQPHRWVSITELMHYSNGHPEILPYPIGTRLRHVQSIEITDQAYLSATWLYIEATAVRVERREGVWGFCTTWRRA